MFVREQESQLPYDAAIVRLDHGHCIRRFRTENIEGTTPQRYLAPADTEILQERRRRVLAGIQSVADRNAPVVPALRSGFTGPGECFWCIGP